MAADHEHLREQYASGQLCGWTPDWAYAQQSQAANPHKTLAQAAPEVAERDYTKDVFLWRFLYAAVRRYLGDPTWQFHAQYQRRGTCVGQGWKLLLDLLMAVQDQLGYEGAEGGPRTKFVGRACVAGVYAGGRVEIAGQPGGGDGSNGYWVADYVKKYGILLMKDVGLAEDDYAGDEKLATSWCASRAGVPAEKEAIAKTRPVRSTTKIDDWQALVAAISNGYAVAECSNIIPESPDKDGIARSTSGGGHCELYTAVRPKDELAWLQNSWNDSFGAKTKYVEDQPPGGLWVPRKIVERQLAQGDSHIASHADGFPRQQLPDWASATYL